MLKDRREAGIKLAQLLTAYANKSDVIVLALPRGGVPVAFEVAKALRVPLDVFIVRKIGVPGHPELALGAIASGGVFHVNEELLARLNVPKAKIESVVRAEQKELRRREALYRSNTGPLDVRNRRVILVDDGLATGASMLAAIRAIKQMGPKKIVVAVPVLAGAAVEEIRSRVDGLECILSPYDFRSVGEWYESFGQTSDEEVKQLLELANQTTPEIAC